MHHSEAWSEAWRKRFLAADIVELLYCEESF